ncbi:MAG: hypothetical protein ACIAQZ_12065 [Sedimentisphaeraceae bacterium JB056]
MQNSVGPIVTRRIRFRLQSGAILPASKQASRQINMVIFILPFGKFEKI